MRSSPQVARLDPASGRRMGWPNWGYAVLTASPDDAAYVTVFIMADPRHNTARAEASIAAAGTPQDGVLLTQTDFDALIRELEALRSKHRGELAGRLREARAFGSSSENDDLLAAFEESVVEQARLAKLEELVRLAVVVDSSAAGDGGAGLGSTVRVADDKGRTTEYDLIGRRSQDSDRHEITLASPVGKALWGARPGDVVQVRLPNGRSRTLRVLDVRHGKFVGETGEGVIRAA
jgi:transcription elongation factor GreA